MKLVETFAGVGGFYQGARLHGAQCVMATDHDPAPAATFAANHPHVPLWVGDVRGLDPDRVPDCDVMTGGFPCQAFSRNGKWFKNDRTVGDDDRANLFLQLVRLIAAKRPRAFLLENVKGLLTIRNLDGSRYFDTIMAAFDGIGYDFKWKLLSPHMFGVPQRRERVFMVGFRRDLASYAENFRFPVPVTNEAATIDILEGSVDPRHLAENVLRNRKTLVAKDGIPVGTSRLGLLRKVYAEKTPPTKPTGKITPVAILYGDTPSRGARQQDKVYSRFGLCPTLTTFELTVPVFDVEGGWRRLTPRECARLQGFPDTFRLPERDHLAYKQMGNAVCVKVVEEVFGAIVKTGVF